MTDAMISYSRADRAFVEELSSKLEEAGLQIWIDLEGIYYGEEFWPRICSAIEEANTVVYMVSSASLALAMCKREVDYALQHNKRLIPVLLDGIGKDVLPEAVATRHYIEARTGTESALEPLTTAIRKDPEWVHQHTRLLVRAREWENSSKEASFLLQGRDLERAESWLKEVDAHQDPQPTVLQTNYLIASRKNATKRQRLLVTSLAFGLILTAVLAIAAFTQSRAAEAGRKEAVRQETIAQKNARIAQSERAEAIRQKGVADQRRREAEEQRRLAEQRQREAELQQSIAESRNLASSALLYARSDSVQSLRLALAAVRTFATRQSQSALRMALQFARIKPISLPKGTWQGPSATTERSSPCTGLSPRTLPRRRSAFSSIRACLRVFIAPNHL